MSIKVQQIPSAKILLLVAVLLAAFSPYYGQLRSDIESKAETGATVNPPKTIFRDSDGNLISNNEFVDIRMANFHLPDRTLIRTLGDGTIEFRLQKVPQEGAEAPDFFAQYVDGTPVKLSELRGKVVVLNFWFIGCPACRRETPLLNDFAAKFAGEAGLEFIGLTYNTTASVNKYLAANKFDYKNIADAKPILASFVIGGYPKNIVIGKDGRIVYWRSGIHAWDKFERVVRAELAK